MRGARVRRRATGTRVGYAATRLPFGGLLSDLSGQGDVR
jgi:hypothetical protein